MQEHAEILANRVKKRYEHLRKRFKKQNIDCFRLYDWDIPEVRAVVDWYDGHIVIGEYTRTQTGPGWLPRMAQEVVQALGLPPENIHVKKRSTKNDRGSKYAHVAKKGKRFTVNERDLKFWINPSDFLDTGLYSDHRNTRVLFRDMAKDEDVINLYAYTGAFSCAAAKGGAKSIVTVDRSASNIKWAKDNFALNDIAHKNYTFIQSDVDKFLSKVEDSDRKFTLGFVDPPSFFNNESTGQEFDVNLDHMELLQNVLKIMAPGATLFFSTNHQRFEPQLEKLDVDDLKELTPKTIPEDFRNQQVHRCWQMTVK
ncbi:MAG: 23S rRNA (cytosine1962-C5)-methyltransferase [Lysobacterales bacterium]